MISPSFIKELIDRVDIYEVVNRRIPLQAKGETGWACCPFHNEKTASFSVSRDKQFFHCFGCGESGNVIGFMMKYEGLAFVDAVEKLANESGIQVRYEGGKKRRDPASPKLSELMLQAQQFYQSKLNENPAAMKYITDRGLSAATISKFGIGYAPDGWRNLSAAFPRVPSKYLIEVGLQREGKNGGDPYDFFRNRLMFPIRNVRGQTIAFSARTMTGEEPKYINTGDTVLFTKGNEVFGLHEALKSIREAKRAIVVEGQMDVIQLSQAGFGESCAPLGTAIKTEHIEKLLKLTDNIVFSFDGDNAGHKAAKRAMTLSLPLLGDKQKIRFVFLPDGEDPDSYIKNFGAEAFEEYLKKSKPLSEYLVSSLSEGLDLHVPEDKASFLAEAQELLKTVRSPVYKALLFEQITKAVNLTETEFLAKEVGMPKPATESAGRPYSGFRAKGYWKDGKFVPAREENKFGRIKRIPPTEENLLKTLLRDFLYYPQLILAFESASEEYLATVDSIYARAIFEILTVVSQEGEDGYALMDELREMQSLSHQELEDRVERMRMLILNFVSTEEEVRLCEEELAVMRQLKTDYKSAELETNKIFISLEISRIKEEKQKLSREGLQSEDHKAKYRGLQNRTIELEHQKKEIDQRLRAIQADM